MSNEAQREVFRVLRESQSKYTYFLLAAAGAAIGFSLSQTKDVSLAESQWPLGLGVLLWGISFFFGCRHLAYVNSTLYANAALLKIESGQDLGGGNHPQGMQAASEGVRNAIEKNSESANQLGHWQFRFLIAGAVCYIIWHVLEMYLRISQ